jgi:hypothetical protein
MSKKEGKRGGILAGLKTKSLPAEDASRAPIGKKHPSVDTGANRSEPSGHTPTIGPRSA